MPDTDLHWVAWVGHGAERLLALSASRAALNGSLGKDGVGVADSGQPSSYESASGAQRTGSISAAPDPDIAQRPARVATHECVDAFELDDRVP
jgi:hypothetical protein